MTTMVKKDLVLSSSEVQTESVLDIDKPASLNLWKHEAVQTREDEFVTCKKVVGVGVQAEMIDIDLLLKEQRVKLQREFD
mmetsp:Transcript_4248/g.6264  ORF Transcript_4248/g.6264 Transcript_4248/m.6264 type:complete len:80 (+) Transcript_4248:249-488(+)